MTFASVIGQSHITETLRNAIARGQLAHAYLFTGPRGVGKTTCARIFARAINCLTPTPDNEACGQCESCRAFAADRSFNIHELDAASNNGVEDIRALTEQVRIAPQIGTYSVYIIDEVHMLSTSAFNAFLKTLEEPPAHAIFILATTEKHKILPTILSRCQTYDFNRIRVDDTVKYLRYICEQQGVVADDESLHIIALAADGGMRDALSTFDRVVSFCGDTLSYAATAQAVGTLDFATYFAAIDMALAADYSSLLMLLDDVLGKGFDVQNFIGGITTHVRSLLVAKNPKTLPLLEATEVMGERYAEQASRTDVEFLFKAVNMLSVADSAIRSATNRRLHVELALMKLCGLVGSDLAAVCQRAVIPKVAISQSAAMPAPPAPVVAPAPEPVVTPAPATQKSVIGFSINAPTPQREGEVLAANSAAQSSAPQMPPMSSEQIESVLKDGFVKIVELWNSRNRPRISIVLSAAEIESGGVKLYASNEVLFDELVQSKLDIERDIVELLALRAPVVVELREETSFEIERPVTLEQRLQFLVDKNPNILKLREALDLTT